MGYKTSAILSSVFLSASLALAQSPTLIQQASNQFRTAEKAEAALNEKPEDKRTRDEYVKVIRAYERVYLITPHTGWADNALTSIARLYEEIKDSKNAIKTLRFLVHEYPQTPLRDMAERDIARLSGAEEVGVKGTASVENIRFWEEDRTVRVVVDLTGEATFKTGEAKSPDRFYIDISPARLNSMLLGKEWPTESKMFQKIRVAQYDGSTVRVVLDGTGAKGVTTFPLRDPNRIIIDVAGSAAPPKTSAGANAAPAPRVVQPSTSPVPAAVAATPDPGDSSTIAPSASTTASAASTSVPTTASAASTSVPTTAPAASTSVPTTAPAASTSVPTTASAASTSVPTTASAASRTASTTAPAVSTLPANLPPAVETSPAAVSAAPDPLPAANVDPVRVAVEAKSANNSLIRSLGLKLSRVVIDAGHGGHDTGSIGPTGFTEKDLVLDVSKRLKVLIESEMGAEVVMTRSDDTFIPLESRTKIANSKDADLFISIHANSSQIKSVRGVETFFLNFNTQSRDAIMTATRENAASELNIHDLHDIVEKITLNDKVDESRELAGYIQSAMSNRSNAGANRGVKQAPFVVLIGARIPSVLAEISFISNPEEERKLKTAAYRQQIADSLFQGIKSYAETLSSTKTAKSQEKN